MKLNNELFRILRRKKNQHLFRISGIIAKVVVDDGATR